MNDGNDQDNKNEELVEAFKQTIPKDWHYIAEGALNLALKYIGKDKLLKGVILRVRKDNPEASGGKINSNPWAESLKFVDKIVLPFLGRRYVQPSVEVPLPKGYMKELGKIIESSRPVKRRVHSLDFNLKTGLLMVDNTSIPVGDDGPSICFELKLKCGFLPTTPFISHEVKYRKDRFTMHNQQKYAIGKLDTISRYSPVELFSYDAKRVLKALNALVETPQNNFRMFVDGVMVYPDSKGHGGRTEFEKILKNYPDVFSKGGVDGLLEVLKEMLISEPLLDRIKNMQMLDDCDIEGTFPAYEQIVSRGEKIVDLVDCNLILPRSPPNIPPAKSNPKSQHDTVSRFMLSCTAKDCSTMIVMKPSNSKTSPKHVPSFRNLDPELYSNERTIVEAHGYMYSIAVVDLDPKPITKMPHYFKLDKEIAEFYTKAEVEKTLA